MNKLLYFFLCLLATIFLPVASYSQYILNGTAARNSCNCYTLTTDKQNISGSVWQSTKIDLNVPFDFSFKVNLGCRDVGGADGIVFILQTSSTSIGLSGEGLGFSGINSSIGVSLDTYQNPDLNDPYYDHISIQANGEVGHFNDLASPVPASATSDNIEDCQWHIFRIKWDPQTHILSTFFDGVFRLSANKDIISAIFNNDPMVYWGFSAATGVSYNIQQFCTQLDPSIKSTSFNNGSCIGSTALFVDSSQSFSTIKNYFWDFGDGFTSTEQNPEHSYDKAGTYQIKHTITGADDCVSEPFVKTILVGDQPVVSFKIIDPCENYDPQIEVDASVEVGIINQWDWKLNGISFSKNETPDFTKLTHGNYSLKLTTSSNLGCVSNSYSKDFTVKPKPVISFAEDEGCKNSLILFSGQQEDNITTINKWFWTFGDDLSANTKDPTHSFSAKGVYSVQLLAASTNGCIGSFSKNFTVRAPDVSAGEDTVVLPNTFFQLNGSGGTFYNWTPSTGLSNPDISNPTGSVNDDIRYLLTAKDLEGCSDTASVQIIIFRGSAVYVPTAFTPNNDGLNDILKPNFKGMKKVIYFSIYDRFGEKVFSTNQMNVGWDGYFKGKQNSVGSYVWVLKAEDQIGHIYNEKGSFVLIK
jgi:gliding motility-associated-like protein